MKVCIALGTLHAGLVPGQEPESPWAISHPRDTTSGNKVPKHPLPAEIRRSGEFQALHMVSLSSAFLWKGLRKGRSHCTGGFGTGCLAATQLVTFGGWCWRCSVHLEGICAAGPGAVCLCWAEPRCPWVSDTAPCSRRWPGGQMPALVGVPVTASRGADQTNQAELCN